MHQEKYISKKTMSMWSCPIGISAAAGNPTRDTWTSCLSQCRAAMRVMWLTGSEVVQMSEEQFRNEKMYHATMNIAKSLMEQGAMTAEEYGQIDTIFREKYRPILVSLQTEMSGYKADSMASCDTDKEG